MSEFEKWSKRNWKNYSFTKWKKDFGQRLVGKYEKGGFFGGKNIVLVYHFTERKPSIEDLADFIKDFERFYDQYKSDFDIDGAYLVVYEEYDKKAFSLLLKKMDEDLRGLITIKMLEKKMFVSHVDTVVADHLKNKEYPPSSEQKPPERKKAFIVHGRDRLPALELKVLVEDKYPIKTIMLEKEAHGGKTLLEKLEEYSDVDYAFVTLTPDDVGALKGEPLKERGRQNVIFEWGLFLGRINRKNVCLLIKGDVDIPSDLRGIGHYKFRDSIDECFLGIDTELRKAKMI